MKRFTIDSRLINVYYLLNAILMKYKKIIKCIKLFFQYYYNNKGQKQFNED